MTRHARPTPGQRPLRVGEELRHALARLFERGALKHPDLQGVAVTVTEVRVSPDLKRATAFVMPLAGTGRDSVLAALARSAPFLRRAVAQDVKLRHAPALEFALDTSFDHASRIATLLGQPEVKRDLASGADEDDEP